MNKKKTHMTNNKDNTANRIEQELIEHINHYNYLDQILKVDKANQTEDRS